jgi:hypothetical protein
VGALHRSDRKLGGRGGIPRSFLSCAVGMSRGMQYAAGQREREMREQDTM